MEALASYRRGSNLPGTCLQLGPWESRLTQNLEFSSDSLLSLMDNHTGIPLILRSMFAPYTVQIIAKINGDAISSNLAYRDDPLFRSIIPAVARPVKKSSNKILTENEISDVMMQTLRRILELKPSEQLGENSFFFSFFLYVSSDNRLAEPSDSLISCGIDSISFAQVRGKVMNQLEVEVPMKFLSDSFTIGEIVEYVKESYKSLHR
jgi:acyl carrier protein